MPKISVLPAAASAALSDLVPAVQGGITKKETWQQVLNLVAANITITEAQVTGLVADLASKLALAGGTMTGAIAMGGFKITGLGTPTLTGDAATKGYVDSVVSGLNPIPGVQAATTVALTVTYANGTAGVGATLTNAGAQAAFAVDGYSASLGDRILVKNQASTFQNGVYTVTTLGSGASNWVLTRAVDYNTPAAINVGDLVAIANGTVGTGASYLETAIVTTIGSDPITFSIYFNPASFLKVSNNLSDVANVATALSNLGVTTNGTAAVGQLPGETSTGNAAAGKVGEFISSIIASGAPVNLPTATSTNITSISLTAGDWDVWGNINFSPTVGLQNCFGWISSTSATLPDGSLYNYASIASAFGLGMSVPQRRFSLSGTTTIYLSGQAAFGAGSASGHGGIYARRAR